MLKTLSCLALVALLAGQANAAFVVPDSAAAPFEDWSRGAADSVYAEWDSFSVAYDAPGNAPDVGASPSSGSPSGADAVLTGLEPSAFVVSSGNIYSFSAPPAFSLSTPGHGYGGGYNTRVAAQIGVQGNPLDSGSLLLTYNDGSADVTAAPDYLLNRGLDGAKTEWLAVWDIAGYNPAATQIDFMASGSSMSLDTLAVDTFTQTGAFTALPANVPEPAAAALAALGCVLLQGRRRVNG